MNVALLNAQAYAPTARDLMERALEPHILLGMPHLTPYGLSETWLMKELGHRHWLLLARSLGMDDADFRTTDGRAVYAAICATSLQNARLDLARPNDVLTVHSALEAVSRTQYSSRHQLRLKGKVIGDVELISAFVCHGVDGNNHSLARIDYRHTPSGEFLPSKLAEEAAVFRRERRGNHPRPEPRRDPIIYTPSTTENFNGAGLFYFAEFQAFCTRALETLLPGSFRTVTRRDLFFFGNIQQGEDIGIVDNGSDANHAICEIVCSDGKIIGLMRANA